MRNRQITQFIIKKVQIFIKLFMLFLGVLFMYRMSIPIHSYQEKKVVPIIASWTTESLPSQICFREPEIDFFMYHYIRSHDERDNSATQDLSIDPTAFRTHMSYVRSLVSEWKVSVMNGNDFIDSVESGCFPWTNIWVFTSDDGWSDSYDALFPIAREYNIPFFMGIIWNRINTPGFVTSQQVIEISKNPLFTISSHSMTHAVETDMSEASEQIEICESKKNLEKLIWIPVFSYIYPVGHMGPYSKKILEWCGYTLAWSTGFGKEWNPKNPSRYDINRIRMHNTTSIDHFKRTLEWNKIQ